VAILLLHHSDRLVREVLDSGARAYILKSVQLLAERRSSIEVAAVLGISIKIVETHRANIMRKLEMHFSK